MAWPALLKLAVTFLAASIVTVQTVLVPPHAPPQPVKRLPSSGVTMSVTVVPLARLAAQVPEVAPEVLAQKISAAALAINPEPVPVATTESAKVSANLTPLTRRTKK